MLKLEADVYLHSSKETNYEQGRSMGLTGAALDNFMYACYEVRIGLEVDAETGDAVIVSVDGREVKR
jgi:hypothetical protein